MHFIVKGLGLFGAVQVTVFSIDAFARYFTYPRLERNLAIVPHPHGRFMGTLEGQNTGMQMLIEGMAYRTAAGAGSPFGHTKGRSHKGSRTTVVKDQPLRAYHRVCVLGQIIRALRGADDRKDEQAKPRQK